MNNLKKLVFAAVVNLSVINWNQVVIASKKNLSTQTDPFSGLRKNGYHRIRSLNGKQGEFLGYIYVKENPKYANHVLAALLVVKAYGSKLDTLYQINAHGDFVASDGKIELTNRSKGYYGFKLYEEKKDHADFFDIGEVNKKGTLFSDDNVYFIDWSYEAKKFAYDPAP